MTIETPVPDFDIKKINKLLGTNFENFDVMTEHQLLAVLVTLIAMKLDVQIFNCHIKDESNGT